MRCTRPHTIEYHTGTGKTVPCGYCPACKYNERVAWTFRTSEEAKHAKEAWFITLTYDQLNVPLLDQETGEIIRGMHNNRSDMNETLYQPDAIIFLNSLKKAQNRAWKNMIPKTCEEPKLRYYLVGEYGGKYGRPHYHIIIFNLWQELAEETRLEEIWQKGRIETESLSPALIHYATGYIHEKNHYIVGKQIKPKMNCSKGWGAQYIERNKQYHKKTLNPFIRFNGYKIAIPKYYKEKIFDADELELINEKINEHFTDKSEPPLMERTKLEREQIEYSIKIRNKKHKKI